MRVQLKESKVSNLVLPRGAFLKGLVALIAAPAIVKAESLMPISVWRPRLEAWRTRAFCQDWLVVHQFDLDDFHAGRFDVSLLPDWVRKSPACSPMARAVGLSCSASTIASLFRPTGPIGLNVTAQPLVARRREPRRRRPMV
jgi:hypothetical protein